MKTEKLRILYVAYPLLPVSDESAGGAEQMLWTLEREMHSLGHSTVVAACEGSRISGELLITGSPTTEVDAFEQRNAEHTARVVEFACDMQRGGAGFDLVHDKSGLFFSCASVVSAPVLATLHLAPSLYNSSAFRDIAPNVTFNCVSESQLASFRHLPGMAGVVENGIGVARFPFCAHKRDYLLWMGRICEEKGTHVAIDIAQEAGMPLIIAGQVYPFSYHQEYFAREVAPRIERANVQIQFVQRPSFADKVKLLQNARAVLIPVLIDETSSLIAMEAMACGTPVIAFRRGALPEVVAHHETGMIVDSAEEMVGATKRIKEIDAKRCRERVEVKYDSRRMANDYERLYMRILQAETGKRHAA